MPRVQFYNDLGDASLFEKKLTINLEHPNRKLKRYEVTTIFRQLGFKIHRKWIKKRWGWSAKINRVRKEAP